MRSLLDAVLDGDDVMGCLATVDPQWAQNVCYNLLFECWAHGIKMRQPTGFFCGSLFVPFSAYRHGPPEEK